MVLTSDLATNAALPGTKVRVEGLGTGSSSLSRLAHHLRYQQPMVPNDLLQPDAPGRSEGSLNERSNDANSRKAPWKYAGIPPSPGRTTDQSAGLALVPLAATFNGRSAAIQTTHWPLACLAAIGAAAQVTDQLSSSDKALHYGALPAQALRGGFHWLPVPMKAPR